MFWSIILAKQSEYSWIGLYSEFFWSVFSHIRTEYGEILRIQSKCGVIRTRKTLNRDIFYAAVILDIYAKTCPEYTSLFQVILQRLMTRKSLETWWFCTASICEKLRSQVAFTCSKLTIEILEQDVEYVQS